jgi:hypothetical protein
MGEYLPRPCALDRSHEQQYIALHKKDKENFAMHSYSCHDRADRCLPIDLF